MRTVATVIAAIAAAAALMLAAELALEVAQARMEADNGPDPLHAQ